MKGRSGFSGRSGGRTAIRSNGRTSPAKGAGGQQSSAPRGSPTRSAPRNAGDAESLKRLGRWVVGIHSCEEALKVRPKAVRKILARADLKGALQVAKIEALALKTGVGVEFVAKALIDQIAQNNQGVALAVQERPQVDWAELAKPGCKTVFLLDGLEDPQNFGSILRTGWLTGASAIFLPKDKAVGLTPTVCKVASGGAEHLAVDEIGQFEPIVRQLKEIGFWVFGLSEAGQRAPWEHKLPEKIAWVLGSEDRGMRRTTETLCDELVRIPQVKSGSSYNAAIALSMALAETSRQHSLIASGSKV